MSLANKYRPQTFDEMIGQEHISDILKAQMIARDKSHHNYLLFWPRGTGKTTSARLIAKGLNCLNLQNGNPCNECSNCQLINAGTSLDYTEIDAASHTGVDNIREEIIDKALYPPTTLQKKIYVIDEVHMLSKGAFNALLKTIEEPKSNVCFIFATTEIHKVPDTIISRCQVFNYRKVPTQAMTLHLEKICKAEGLGYTLPALETIANISEWCVRDAVKYIDQVSILWEITEGNITKFLGVAGENTIKTLLETIKKGDRNQIFEFLDTIAQSGVDLWQFTKQTIGYIDQHLLEDTDFYLKICSTFWEILGNLRRYPYPIVAYKISLNNYLNPEKQLTTSSVPQISQSSVSTPVAVSVAQPPAPQQQKPQSWPVNLESKSEVATSALWSVQSEVVKGESSSTQPAPAVAPKAEPQPVATSSQMQSWTNDLKSLWQSIVAQIPKPTAQANLKDQAIIEAISENTVEIIVITKIAEMLLKNEEIKKLVESLLTTSLWKSVQLQVVYEAKESYFARKMGL